MIKRRQKDTCTVVTLRVSWIIVAAMAMNVQRIHGAFTNLALGKPASQSSTYPEGEASRAVDGNKNNAWEGKSCSHTDYGPGWWRVDLEETAIIYEIKIMNRNTIGERLGDINILVGKSLESLEICEYFEGPGQDGIEYTIPCRRPLTGKYVKIQQLIYTGPLTLCEVEVLGIAGEHAIFSLVPNEIGSSAISKTFQVSSKFECPVLCLQDITCVGYNLIIQSSSNFACEVLKYSIDQTASNNETLLFYH